MRAKRSLFAYLFTADLSSLTDTHRNHPSCFSSINGLVCLRTTLILWDGVARSRFLPYILYLQAPCRLIRGQVFFDLPGLDLAPGARRQFRQAQE